MHFFKKVLFIGLIMTVSGSAWATLTMGRCRTLVSQCYNAPDSWSLSSYCQAYEYELHSGEMNDCIGLCEYVYNNKTLDISKTNYRYVCDQSCPQNTYYDPQDEGCWPCEVGFVNSTNHFYTSCVSCLEGQVNQNGTCVNCGPGTYSTSPTATSCSKCPSGTYSSGSANINCTRCPPGQYASGSGNTKCRDCSAGTYNIYYGMSSCEKCSPGTYQEKTGMDSCSNCDNGYYQDEYGATSCKECPDLETGNVSSTSYNSINDTYPNHSSKEACYIYANSPISDDTGTYVYETDCFWLENN